MTQELIANTPLSAENVGLLKAGVSVLRTKSGHLVTPVEGQGMSGWIAYRHLDNDHRAATMVSLLTYIGPDLGDGWIGWSGGGCPVTGRADVKHQNGSISEDVDVVRALWWWRHEDPEDNLNIIAFRPALSPPAEGEEWRFCPGANGKTALERVPTPTPTPAPVDWSVVGPKLVEALERIADPRNIHFAGDAQVAASRALDAVDLNIKAALAAQPSAGAQGEAVGWVSKSTAFYLRERCGGRFVIYSEPQNDLDTALYATPAQPDTALSSKPVAVSEGADGIDKPDTGDVAALRSEYDAAFKIASDLHKAYEQLIYGLPKYLEDKGLTDEENMIREAFITLDVTAHRLAALSKPNAPGAA